MPHTYAEKMKRLIPTIFYIGLIGWGVSLWIIVLSHADLLSIGRDRAFAIITNLVFLFTTSGGILWAATKAKMLLTPMIVGFGLWIMAFLGFGFWPYTLGLFGAPSEAKIREAAQANGYSEEWIEKAIHGPAVSAATGYMVDVYQWVLLFDVRQPR